MGALMLMLTLFGVWLLVAALMDWEWCLGPIDLREVGILVGEDTLRWIIGGIGVLLILIGTGGG